MKALIIDDSRAVRLVLGKILRQLGYELLEAGDGREGLQRLEAAADAPQLVLVDWNMPQMSGADFVRAVRQDRRWDAVKLVMVTSEAGSQHLQTALEAGANEYVMKPFTREIIEEKLAMLGAVA